jgi:predicted tellurium resistance membrane protein TerC
MDKYPIIIYIGAGVLGKVGGEMIATDPVVFNFLQPSTLMIYGIEAAFAIGVIVAGRLLFMLKTRGKKQPAQMDCDRESL